MSGDVVVYSAARKSRAPTFTARFNRRYPLETHANHEIFLIGRTVARRLLDPVPWNLIPAPKERTLGDSHRSARVAVIRFAVLRELCARLDEVGATPRVVTSEQLLTAWRLAGQEGWLKRAVSRERVRRAMLNQIARDLEEIGPEAILGHLALRSSS